MTLAEIERANGGKYPGFAFLRHFLSVAILLHHCRVAVRGERLEPLADFAAAPGAGFYEQIIAFCHLLTSIEVFRPVLYGLVGSFFALSGFLVAGSAVRTGSVRTFLAFRGLRIVPALLSEVTLSAIVLGACLTSLPLAEYYGSTGFFRYFGNIAGFVTFYLPGVFETNPIKGIVNINLWTLTPEFYCYLAMAGLISLGVFRNKTTLLVLFMLASIAILMMTISGQTGFDTRENSTHFPAWFIVYLFFAGVVFYCFSEYIRYEPWWMAACGIVYMAGMLLRIPDIISCLALVYFTVSIGVFQFKAFKFLNRYDYSYGIYLYGYPIAQTLINVLQWLGLFGKTWLVYSFVTVATLIFTLLFSALSWTYVEKPFLGLKRFIVRSRRAKESQPATPTNTAVNAQ